MVFVMLLKQHGGISFNGCKYSIEYLHNINAWKVDVGVRETDRGPLESIIPCKVYVVKKTLTAIAFWEKNQKIISNNPQ